MARFALYWPYVHDYIVAGAQELQSRGHEVALVIAVPPASGRDDGVDVTDTEHWDSLAYGADVELFCGWHLPALTRHLRVTPSSPVTRVLYFDTQWRGTARQRLRLPFARLRLTRAFDGCFVPGSRQVEFAKRLGFAGSRIMAGALTYHFELFDAVPLIDPDNAGNRRQFIFAGRGDRGKGYDVLLSGYDQYRAGAADPWRLVIAGAATPRPEGFEECLGFISHDQLATAMAASSCLILPSRSENFGAVVLEAAAAGLLLLVTPEVGAREDLLEPGANGFEVDPLDATGVARAMHRLASATVDELTAGSQASRRLAAPFTPVAWADSMERALDWRA